jgi:putative pyruvate formate lyase activating enzyme
MTDKIIAARAALHMWEEPCVSGKEGSGAVFFSGCPLRCVFCQNRPIALGKAGKEITVRRLADIFLELRDQGASNINLVTPTHYVPQIIEAVRCARGMGLSVPIVYNTGSFELPETIRLLKGTVDVFLPDLKFRDPEIAERYADAPDYFGTACAAIREMMQIAGEPQFDERGMMRKGVIVRHMILPGHTKDSEAIIDYLYSTYGNRIFISIMNQYTPMAGIGERFPELARKVTKREYERVLNFAIGLGIENAYYQDGGTAKESFIPVFDGEGI